MAHTRDKERIFLFVKKIVILATVQKSILGEIALFGRFYL